MVVGYHYVSQNLSCFSFMSTGTGRANSCSKSCSILSSEIHESAVIRHCFTDLSIGKGIRKRNITLFGSPKTPTFTLPVPVPVPYGVIPKADASLPTPAQVPQPGKIHPRNHIIACAGSGHREHREPMHALPLSPSDDPPGPRQHL